MRNDEKKSKEKSGLLKWMKTEQLLKARVEHTEMEKKRWKSKWLEWIALLKQKNKTEPFFQTSRADWRTTTREWIMVRNSIIIINNYYCIQAIIILLD